MSIDDLFEEGRRQLAVCNSCRYCQGYCPVWPALELRTALSDGDLTHLANLCHDCRDCFSACMYTTPHEFELNPPKLFSELRVRTYEDYMWPAGVRGRLGNRALAGAAVGVSALLTVLAVLLRGRTSGRTGSIYALLPYGVVLLLVLLPTIWGVLVTAAAARAYWRDTHGPLRDLRHGRVWLRALYEGLTLRHMNGGGTGCEYPDDEPDPRRRRAHLLLTAGFGLCLVSTCAAAVLQDLLGHQPPYAWWSVPVVTGTLGGLGLLAGCGWLISLKRTSDRALSAAGMLQGDYRLLWALILLAGSGLATLVLRQTVLAEPVLVVHLATIIIAFAAAPYSKFPHFVFRLLAIYENRLSSPTSPVTSGRR